MSLKQSCFKSIVKCDLKRSWWISALAALFIFMTSTSTIFSYTNSNYDFVSYPRYDGTLDFCQSMFGNYVIGMCVAAFVVLFLYSYINKVNSVSFFHSLPATRCTLMSAHILSSSILIVSPMLINTIITLFAVGKGVKSSWILMSFVMYLLYSFIAFALTLIISMLTGVSIASAIFTGVAALLPLFVCAFVNELCNTYFYGFTDSQMFEEFLLNYVYLSPKALMSPKVIVYIVLIAVFVALSYFLYKKRHLENYSEVIAFPELKGLFEVLFALCSGILGYYYFQAFWGVTSILTMLVFGIIGVIIAHMIANRSFSLHGVMKPLLVTVVVVVLLFVVFFFDLVGFEKRIPDADDIEYATIGNVYYDNYTYVNSEINGVGRIRVQQKDVYKPHYTSKEDIEKFLTLHRYAVDHIKENEDCDDDFFVSRYILTERSNVKITYKLKNGKTMSRSYRIPKSVAKELTYDINNSIVNKKYRYPVIDDTPKIYKRIEVYDPRNYEPEKGAIIYPSNEEMTMILEALMKDKLMLPYEIMELKNNYNSFVTLNLVYTMTYLSDKGQEYQVEHSDTYNIDEYDVNTWALLEKLGYFADERKIEVNDIESIGIGVNEFILAEDAQVEYGEFVGSASAVNIETAEVYSTVEAKIRDIDNYRVFTERQDIEELFELYMNHRNVLAEEGCDYFDIYLELDFTDVNEKIRTNSKRLLIKSQDLPEVLHYLKDNIQYK